MRKPQSPCEGCTDRSPDCHADCRFYEWYQQEQEKYRAFLVSQKNPEGVKYSKTRFERIRKS